MSEQPQIDDNEPVVNPSVALEFDRSRGHSRRSRGRQSGFYDDAFVEPDRQALAEAREINGLEEEIALLRLRLRGLIEEKPDDLRLVIQAINTLVRAVIAESRLAGPDQQEMIRRMADAVQQLGSSLLSEP